MLKVEIRRVKDICGIYIEIHSLVRTQVNLFTLSLFLIISAEYRPAVMN